MSLFEIDFRDFQFIAESAVCIEREKKPGDARDDIESANSDAIFASHTKQ